MYFICVRPLWVLALGQVMSSDRSAEAPCSNRVARARGADALWLCDRHVFLESLRAGHGNVR